MKKNGIELITEERQRQISQVAPLEHDRSYNTDDELAYAAAAYALPPKHDDDWAYDTKREDIWPWLGNSWKPSPENRIRELQKAGALIAAEIDRLLYFQT